MEQVKALLFDVFGTVVDWRSGVIRDVTAVAAEYEPARPYTCVAADFGDLADQLGA